jgi:hypothetical protein
MGLFGSLLGAIPGVGTALSIGSGLLGAISGGKAQSKANKLTKQQLDLALKRYAEGAPFRSKLAGLANNLPHQREDLSSLFADPGNPYSRAIPRPSLAAQVPTTATPIAPVGPPRNPLAGPGSDIRSRLAMQMRFR